MTRFLLKFIKNLKLVLFSKLALMGLKNKAICSKDRASVFSLTSVRALTLFRESSLININFLNLQWKNKCRQISKYTFMLYLNYIFILFLRD